MAQSVTMAGQTKGGMSIMRSFIVLLALAIAVMWTGSASADSRADIEAVCDKFGPTNKEFCELVLEFYDDTNSRLGDLEGFVGRIPEHPHPAFGYEATKRDMDALRADMEAGDEGLDGKIGRVPEHPHPAFGYEATKRELSELRAAIEELQGKVK